MSDRSGMPRARYEGLITEALADALLIYDTRNNLAHALEPYAAAIWRACDGHSDISALAARCSISEEEAEAALAHLSELALLEDSEERAGDTRRTALRKIAIGGAAIASTSAISSILVPVAAAAGSCVQPGTCVLPGQTCCAGHPIDGFGECNFQPGDQLCCNPPGTCATPSRDLMPQVTCCNDSYISDNSCSTGVRCT